jgi:flagella basal body P-ring formation protein FlgA
MKKLSKLLLLALIASVPTLGKADYKDDLIVIVKQGLASNYPSQELDVVFDYPELLKNGTEKPEVKEVKDLGSGRFQVFLKNQDKPLGGKVDVLIDVPVLKSPLSTSSTIKDDDIEMKKMILNKLAGEVILKKEDLVGKKPKGKIIPNHKPILPSDLHVPISCKKDALFTIICKAPNLVLTTRGKALKDGIVGETVRFEILNAAKKVVDAAIVDEHTAEIIMPSM